MSLWSSISGGVSGMFRAGDPLGINPINEGISGYLQGKRADEQFNMTKEQWDYQKNAYENQVSIRAKDMKNAGFNPVLAAGASAGSMSPISSNTGHASPLRGTSSIGDASGAVSSLMNAMTNKTAMEAAIGTNAMAARAARVNAEANMLNARTNAGIAPSEVNRNTSAADLSAAQASFQRAEDRFWHMAGNVSSPSASQIGKMAHDATANTVQAANGLAGTGDSGRNWSQPYQRIDDGAKLIFGWFKRAAGNDAARLRSLGTSAINAFTSFLDNFKVDPEKKREYYKKFGDALRTGNESGFSYFGDFN